MKVSLNRSSRRRQRALIARRITGWVNVVIGLVVLVLAVAGLSLVLAKSRIGWSLLGAASELLVLQIWLQWHVLNPSRRHVPISLNQDLHLDEVLEPKLLSRLPWPANPEQTWRAALLQWEGVFMVNRLMVPVQLVSSVLHNAGDPQTLWQAAAELAAGAGMSEIDSAVVVAAVLNLPVAQPVLRELKLSKNDVSQALYWQRQAKNSIAAARQDRFFGGIARDWASGYTPLLSRLSYNITNEVERHSFDAAPQLHLPALQQLVNHLASGRPAALVGQVGSGKTSLVYSFAKQLLEAKDTKGLEYSQVIRLNASILISSGTNLEQLVLQLLAEAIHAGNIIIFLDDAQLFFGQGHGSVDLSQILIPILQQRSLRLLLAFTPHDWQALVEANAGLASLMQRVVVPEASQPEAMAVLEFAALGLEHRTSTLITLGALKESIRLSERYLPELALPGKAVTVLENATNYHEGGLVTAQSVQKAVEATTGAKISAASVAEKDQLLNLESIIHQRMVNQSRAVSAVADALRRNRSGVANPNRPVGSFLFLGPTGVGKTELAKVLADVYYGGRGQLVRLDMTEYQQPSDTSRFLSPAEAGQSGSSLVAMVRSQPSSVVLLDEIEKAHPDVLNLLLQLLDEGRLTDNQGRLVSFKDAIIIATSNAEAEDIRHRIESGQKLEQFQDDIVQGLISSHLFKPELLNRFDEIVVFRPLDQSELLQIVGHILVEINATLADQHVIVRLTDAAAQWIVERGYDPRLGARPMRRMVQKTVENITAKKLLAGQIGAGSEILLDAADLAAATESK